MECGWDRSCVVFGLCRLRLSLLRLTFSKDLVGCLSLIWCYQIGAVDGMQGRYKEVVVLSFVRSNDKGTRIIKRTCRYETGINGSQ